MDLCWQSNVSAFYGQESLRRNGVTLIVNKSLKCSTWVQSQKWGLECKSRKSRDTWSNRQIWPWSTKWSRAKANRVLPREHTGHSKHPLPTTQERLYTWTSLDGQYRNQIDYFLCNQKWRMLMLTIQSAKTRLGADCGSDHELLIAKFRLILKKVGKTTRQFRYDLNQISYDYTVEVTNKFKGLDPIDSLRDWNLVAHIVGRFFTSWATREAQEYWSG